jgi:tight adherence protein C
MNEWLGLALLFVVVTTLCFTVLQGLFHRRQQLEARLAGDSASAGTLSDPNLVLGDMTPALAGQVPMSAAHQAEIQQELRDAGYYRPTALMEYAAIRAMLIFLPLIVACLALLVVPEQHMLLVVVLGILGAMLGYSLPRVYLNYRARWRARQIERGLPVAVDLLTLGLSAGQNILTAFKRVSLEMRRSYPVLSQELQIVASQADLRSLEQALQELAARVRIPEVRTLALILAQSERLGTDIITALLEFASNFRLTMKQRAEAQANRASFWMIFPSLFCLWMPAAVLMVGPVFFEFWHRREAARGTMDMRKTFQDARQKENRFQRTATAPEQETGPGN